jgi:hypothetical protein
MPRPDPDHDLLRSARDAVASSSVREAVRDVALTALRSRMLTAAHIAAVARTIGEGIASVEVTPTAPVRETYRGAWQGLEDAVGRALHALELAAREFAQGRARLTREERERMLEEIDRMERSLSSGWDHRHRIPDSLRAHVAATMGHLRQAVASEAPEGDEAAARDAGSILSLVASGVLLGLGDALGDTPRS